MPRAAADARPVARGAGGVADHPARGGAEADQRRVRPSTVGVRSTTARRGRPSRLAGEHIAERRRLLFRQPTRPVVVRRRGLSFRPCRPSTPNLGQGEMLIIPRGAPHGFTCTSPARLRASVIERSAGDDLRRRHAPASDVLGIASQHDCVPVERDDSDVTWCRGGQHADAAARFRVERQLGDEVARE